MSDAYSPELLKRMQPEKDFFIGFDSDGCVFDTMELKQKECFIPAIVKHFNLQWVSKYLRETAEFVNLYSCHRGTNRFPALVKTMDFLRERTEVDRLGVDVPRLDGLRRWVEEESMLGNGALEERVRETGDPDLKKVLAWSLEINEVISVMCKGLGPFPFVRESLQKAGEKADRIVVSQTPGEALEREWKEHQLDGMVRVICGQEFGTKTEHIAWTAAGKYPVERILMVGDAPGDLRAAQANHALFYPIVPGDEEASWERFQHERLDRFFDGTFPGDYQEQLVNEFMAVLPEKPPW